jgi:hypothetical protein
MTRLPRDRSSRGMAPILRASSIRCWSNGWMIEVTTKNSQMRLTKSVGASRYPQLGQVVRGTLALSRPMR